MAKKINTFDGQGSMFRIYVRDTIYALKQVARAHGLSQPTCLSIVGYIVWSVRG